MPRDVAPPSTRKFQTLDAASAQNSEESQLIQEGRPLSIEVVFSPVISQPHFPSRARRNSHTAQRSKIRLQEEQPELGNADRVTEFLWERTAHISCAPSSKPLLCPSVCSAPGQPSPPPPLEGLPPACRTATPTEFSCPCPGSPPSHLGHHFKFQNKNPLIMSPSRKD